MTTQLRRTPIRIDRMRERMIELSLNPTDVARAGDLERTFVADLMAGKKKSIRRVYLQPLADALRCNPEFLTGEAGLETPTEISFPAPRMMRKAENFLDLVGTIENGVFRTQAVERERSPVRADIRHLGLRQAVYTVAGDDMAMIGIPAGTFVTAIDVDDYLDRVGPLKAGSLAVVLTQIEGVRGRELSLCRIAIVDGRTELRAPTARSDLPTIVLDGLVAEDGLRRSKIIGIMTASTVLLD